MSIPQDHNFLCCQTIMWVLCHLRSQWLVQYMKRRCQKWRCWGSGGFILLAQTLFSKGQRCVQICSFSKTKTLCDWNNWLFISQEHLLCEWDYYYEFCYCTCINLEWSQSQSRHMALLENSKISHMHLNQKISSGKKSFSWWGYVLNMAVDWPSKFYLILFDMLQYFIVI